MNTTALFQKRRSVNSFDPSQVLEVSKVKNIIDLATLAPSAFNLQPWRIIVVSSPESKQKLFDLSNKQPKIIEAPVTLIIVGDKEGYSDANPVWAEMLQSVGGNQDMVNGARQAAAFLYGSSEERKIKFAESNAGLLAMAIIIAAKEFGVDSHPMSGIDFEGISRTFGLKASENVVMTIALGYHDSNKTLYPRRPRRSFEEIASIV
jgi:putative NAD(P)H nitroreductase